MLKIKLSYFFKIAFSFLFFLSSSVNSREFSKEQTLSLIEQTQISLARKPGDKQLSFVLGMAYQSLEKYNLSIKIFRGLLRSDPNLIRPRLELAKSLYMNKDYEDALYHFEKVLSKDLPLKVEKNIKNKIQEINLFRPRHNFNISFVRDTNPNQSTSKSKIFMQGLEYQLSENAKQYEINGVKFIQSSYIPFNNNFKGFFNFETEHTEYDIKDNNFSSIQSSLGKNFIFNKLNSSLEFGPVLALYGNNLLYKGNFASLKFNAILSNKLNPNFLVKRNNLKYEKDYPGYNSEINIFESGIRYKSTLSQNLFFKIGKIDKISDFNFYGFDEIFGNFSIEKEFSKIGVLNLEYLRRYRKYSGKDPFFGNLRKDRIKEYNLRFNNQNFKLLGMEVQIIWRNSYGKSNQELHTFNRNNIIFELVKVF